ncbi:hypothetical protein [Mycobacterium sp. SMC-4]|uniref:hypothetical protein n=1 Tax=Mycobacterium sp. SMC-4 TaxID=2857059 RepID=UPI003D080E4A
MAARSKKINTDDTFDGAVEVSADQQPVNLDPPNPAIARWQELAERDTDIYHGGDAEKMMPFPRPAWADPDWDDVATTWQAACYRGAPVYVASFSGSGEDDGEIVRPACVRVIPRIHGCGSKLVGINIRRFVGGKWHEWGTSIQPEGALELADVLRAAVEVMGDEK